MSKHFGRNQRRKLREQLAAAEVALATGALKLSREAQRRRAAEERALRATVDLMAMVEAKLPEVASALFMIREGLIRGMRPELERVAEMILDQSQAGKQQLQIGASVDREYYIIIRGAIPEIRYNVKVSMR